MYADVSAATHAATALPLVEIPRSVVATTRGVPVSGSSVTSGMICQSTRGCWVCVGRGGGVGACSAGDGSAAVRGGWFAGCRTRDVDDADAGAVGAVVPDAGGGVVVPEVGGSVVVPDASGGVVVPVVGGGVVVPDGAIVRDGVVVPYTPDGMVVPDVGVVVVIPDSGVVVPYTPGGMVVPDTGGGVSADDPRASGGAFVTRGLCGTSLDVSNAAAMRQMIKPQTAPMPMPGPIASGAIVPPSIPPRAAAITIVVAP